MRDEQTTTGKLGSVHPPAPAHRSDALPTSPSLRPPAHLPGRGPFLSIIVLDGCCGVGYALSNDEHRKELFNHKHAFKDVSSYLCSLRCIVEAYPAGGVLFFDDMPIDIKRIRVATGHKTGKGKCPSTPAGEGQAVDKRQPIHLNAMRTMENGTWPSSANDIRQARHGSLEREEDDIVLTAKRKEAGRSTTICSPNPSVGQGGVLSSDSLWSWTFNKEN